MNKEHIMKNKPSEQMLTKIYAYAMRCIEQDPTYDIFKLCRRISSRYGVLLTSKELLDLLNNES